MLISWAMVARKQYRQLLRQARQHLLETGWSHRRAAKYLERNPTHVSLVLGGRRISTALLQRIASLPPAPKIVRGKLSAKQTKTAPETQAENMTPAPICGSRPEGRTDPK
jgi:hypothetical protein